MKRKTLVSMAVLVMVCSCNNRTSLPADNYNDTTVSEKRTDSLNDDSFESNEGDGNNGKSLNDIRFANFKENDWLDNEYIRFLREYIDDYNKGKVKDAGLDPYKKKVQGKFVIWKAEPFLLGGLYIQFVFLDSPDDIFSSWVYSYVDEDTESITGYEVHGVKIEDEKSGFTKEKILQIVKEADNIKLW